MDCFALLDEPRRPWLDTAALKEKFLARGAETHPDKFPDAQAKATAQARFTDLNTAHDTLADAKRRLAHLLTLERGVKPQEVHDIPPETADLFLEVGALLKPVDDFLTNHESETSALLRAQAMPKALQWLERVEALQQQLNSQMKTLDAELRVLNGAWDENPPLNSVERLYHQYSYLGRWLDQLRDRALRLAL
jgi:curved DNA-binding protein CbpA